MMNRKKSRNPWGTGIDGWSREDEMLGLENSAKYEQKGWGDEGRKYV